MMGLRERCLGLPYRERLNLCVALQDSIVQERRDGCPPNPGRGQILFGYLGDILGEPIPLKSREARFVWARIMVAKQLLSEGFTTKETGWVVDKDHSSVTYMKKRMDDALDYPQMYAEVIDIWKQFQNRIAHEIHRGTTQDLICL